MSSTAQISKEKQQSIITLRHESQSMWKISRTFKVSSSAVAKNIKRYDETGSQERKTRHRKGRPRVTSAAEDKFIRVTSLRNHSPNKLSSSNRYISTTIVQRRLRESGLHGLISAKKPLLKDTNETCLVQETRAMDIRPEEICPLVL